MEVGAELGLNGLEAKWHLLNGRGLVTLALGQAGHPSISAFRAAQLLVPLVDHRASMRPKWCKFHAVPKSASVGNTT